MRRIMAIVAVLLMFVSQPTSAATFSDLEGNNHAEAIYALVEQGIIKGYEDNTYRPNQAVTRNNVVKLLGRFVLANDYNLPEDATELARFEDVSLTKDVELAELAALVQEEGIFVGSEGFLDGASTMQRQHMAVVLVRAINSIYNIDLVEAYQAANFSSNIADLALAGDQEKREAIIALEFAEITVVTQFNPQGTVTRAQFASFLHRALQYAAAHSDGQPEEQLPANDVAGASAIYIAERTKLYASRNMKNYVGLWRSPQTAMSYELIDNGQIAVIQLGTEKYYVHASAISAAPIEPTQSMPTVGSVRTEPYYRILDAPDGNLLLEGVRVTKLEVTGINGNYYSVDAGGQQGYIAMNQTTLSSRLPFKVAEQTAYLNTAMNDVGALSPGFIFSGNGASGDYIKIASNGGTYYVAKKALVEGTTPVSLQKPQGSKYPTKIVAQYDAAVMTSGGAKIGAIAKGQSYTLLNITATKGLVEFAGGIGYINMHDFMHTNQVVPTKNISYLEMEHHIKVFALL